MSESLKQMYFVKSTTAQQALYIKKEACHYGLQLREKANTTLIH